MAAYVHIPMKMSASFQSKVAEKYHFLAEHGFQKAHRCSPNDFIFPYKYNESCTKVKHWLAATKFMRKRHLNIDYLDSLAELTEKILIFNILSNKQHDRQ